MANNSPQKVSNAQLNKAKKTPKPDPGDECPDNIDEAFPIDPPENLLNADTIHELHWWLMEHMKILEDSKGVGYLLILLNQR